MDVTQAAPFHQALVALKEALLTQLAEQRGGTIGRAEAAANHFGQPEDSRAQLATARDLEFAVDERETAHLAAVEAALERIGAGTYGECSDCGADIPPARLHATPEAARCVPCQEKFESHHPAG
jgi:DnaK suppressor protein